MSVRIEADGKTVVIIAPEDEDECEQCGAVAELRPYGKNGKRICWSCAQLDMKTTDYMFRKTLLGIQEH